ncbi:MAG: CotH kinase family protein [Muribaculaceae bacterium]|nr:CotH kinase family protein [Muribaculaceae bacterium]
MNFKKIFVALLCVVAGVSYAMAETVDSQGYPVMYLRGSMTGGVWDAREAFRFTRTDKQYTLHLDELDGQFKIADEEWGMDYGSANAKGEPLVEISDAATVEMVPTNGNFQANGLRDVTLTFDIELNGTALCPTYMRISANGHQAPDMPTDPSLSGTLPVLYINVYTDEEHTALNDEVIDRNLGHKNYFTYAEYWLDLNGCEWMAAEGAESIGSKDEPLPLQIKARGNYTRTAYAKKPFKLKLDKKQSLLGLSNSKHFALLAHADDTHGYMRNFTGFWLGRAIGLPWTPSHQPVEVVINGNYRGLYFLTESIRVEKKRVNITELDDLVDDPALVSGGYLVELDNYDEDNQIKLEEKSCASDRHHLDLLRVTWDTPEEYSDLQKRFITDQFTAMNDAVGAANQSDELWRYMDLDDAARYYLVEEIISHHESYHGSTYLFRDRGEGQKWHFSPLWDCGNAFNGSTSDFFYNCDPFGNTWIPSMRENKTFNDKVKATWLWFMNNGYKGLEPALREYASHLKAAAKADRKRWHDARQPDIDGARPVVDNTDMDGCLNRVLRHLNDKTNWLKERFGNYLASPNATEPARDATVAAPLPDYAKPDPSGVAPVVVETPDAEAEYYNLQGMRVENPRCGNIYIEVKGTSARRIRL